VCVALAPVPLGASPPLPDAPGSHGTHRADLLVHVRDALGSVRVVVDYPEARAVETRDYGPFGERVAQRGAFELQHQFAGLVRDADLDLEFARARMYDRRWCRFLSPDPLAAGFDAAALDRYAYARYRPTSLTDPSGLDPRADAKNQAELIGSHRGETVLITGRRDGIDLGSHALTPDLSFRLDLDFAVASALDTALLHASLEGIPMQGPVAAPGALPGAEAVELHGAALPPDFPSDPVVFLTWRPVRLFGVPVGWHSFLAIWDPATREIYRQFSLTGPERRFDLEGDSDTYQTDRAAFEHPGGHNLVFPITPPPWLGRREFAEDVYVQALDLELPDRYSMVGPYNSNWAATTPLHELGAAYPVPDGYAPGAIDHDP
jgi:RHS repeat-associated protein